MKYFQVFGSKYNILRDKEHLGRFDSQIDEGVFLGYSINSKSYRVYNMRTLIVMESINVIIDDTLVHTDNALDENCDSDNGAS